MARKKAFVFIDFDVSIRHFIQSGAFAALEKAYDVTYVFHVDSTTSKTGLYSDWRALGLARALTLEVPRRRMGEWDRLFCITMLRNQRGTANYMPIKIMMAANARKMWRIRLYEIASLPGIFPLVRRYLLGRLGIHAGILSFLKQHKPDVVLHPTILVGLFINDLVKACEHLGIPCVLLMNSWDNPSSKAVLSAVPDRLVVWGEQTKRHAVEFMNFPAERVACLGAAQFQIYREPVVESDAELRRLFRVPAGKRIILYAGASKGAHESAYLRLLDDCIENGSVPDCHVIYRPHPWRGSLAKGEVPFFDLGLKHITIDPHLEDYYRRCIADRVSGIEMADYRVTRKLLHLVEAVISPLSTILLETTLLGKPILMYFPRRDLASSSGRHTAIVSRLVHFEEFWGVEGVNVCDEPEAFAAAVTRMMGQVGDPRIRKILLDHAARHVVLDGPAYADRLLSLVNELTRPAAAQDEDARAA
jgi:hypothetical protein